MHFDITLIEIMTVTSFIVSVLYAFYKSDKSTSARITKVDKEIKKEYLAADHALVKRLEQADDDIINRFEDDSNKMRIVAKETSGNIEMRVRLIEKDYASKAHIDRQFDNLFKVIREVNNATTKRIDKIASDK